MHVLLGHEWHSWMYFIVDSHTVLLTYITVCEHVNYEKYERSFKQKTETITCITQHKVKHERPHLKRCWFTVINNVSSLGM